jgi:hypothetical protein
MEEKKNKQNRGQLTIFFGVSMMGILTLIAFIINVGIFVKAKINLQNAVDAAAWSGAAVQARQLTNISYLNWEMRNIYKEWMFKYYVLGNLSVKEVRELDGGNAVVSSSGSGAMVDAAAVAGDNKMQFYMMGGNKGAIANCELTGSTPQETARLRRGCPDRFNFPSICIHIGDPTLPPDQQPPDICRLYSVPGLPNIQVTQLAGGQSSTENFIKTLVNRKAKNCADRSDLNFMTAINWMYGIREVGGSQTGFNNSVGLQAPQVALDRFGAFPKALELALRIRTLEHMVNTPPIEQGLCNARSGGAAVPGCENITSFMSANQAPHFERPVKAFFSAYRNLGNDETGDGEMKASFVLTELKPKQMATATDSMSFKFMPANVRKREKFYLDLKAMTTNLVNFYTSFISNDGIAGVQGTNIVGSSASCDATKIALPVPSYPMGFYKNPEILTYYAVKGEANFTGLLNPFDPIVIKLQTYAAAKPFGGRVGPHLLEVNDSSEDVVKGREDSRNEARRTYAYMMGFQSPNPDFRFGYPVPFDSDFWISTTADPIGKADSSDVRFGIPNMIFDFIPGGMGPQVANGANFPIIDPVAQAGTAREPNAGLYDKKQFELLRDNIDAFNSGGGGNLSIDGTQINKAILRVRAPNQYDAANYLIPTPQSISESNSDSIGYVKDSTVRNNSGDQVYKFKVFAPLYNNNPAYLFTDLGEVMNVVDGFLNELGFSLDKYLESMYNVADAIIRKSNDYASAAQGFHNGSAETGPFPNCGSIAAKMSHYLKPTGNVNDTANCPDKFAEQLRKYWTDLKAAGGPGGISALDFYENDYMLIPPTNKKLL